MKKNILTIVIMAASLLNLVLTIVIVFAVVPTMNKTSQLVDKVATAIDLETKEEEAGEYSIESLEPYSITFENKQTINLKPDEGDKESHFAILEGVTISFNTEAEDYKEVSESVKAKDVYISEIVKETIADQSMKTLDQNEVKKQALAKIQELYGSKCIVRLSLNGFMFQ
ncbi:MAG: hypothetical protein PUG66_04290 [Clostridiales bacterium]|nr:hypothetical protein [Clostridiales bacterium]